MTHEAFTETLPEGWTGGEPVTKRWRGDFIHLYRVRRPCKTCAGEISIDVTKRALQGFSKNAGLLLRNCPTCREARKAGGPGSRGGTSRPTVDAIPFATIAPPGAELERLGMMISTMREELDGLYVQNRDLRERLAKYELPAAMAEVARETKMPWDVN